MTYLLDQNFLSTEIGELMSEISENKIYILIKISIISTLKYKKNFKNLFGSIFVSIRSYFFEKVRKKLQ